MKSKEDNCKRERIYIIITMIMAGVLLYTLVYYSYQNNFQKLSFSKENNDVYELGYNFDAMPVKDNQYLTGFSIDLKHDNVHFIRVIAKEITSGDIKATLYTGNFSQNGEFAIGDIFENVILHSGCNDFKLSTKDVEYFEIRVFGINENVIQNIQFRESVDTVSKTDLYKITAIAAFLYILLTAAVIYVYRKHLNSHTNIILSKKKNQLINTVSRKKQSKFATGAVIVLFLSMIIISLSLMIIEGEKGYRNHFKSYICIQLILTVLLTVSLIIKKSKTVAVSVDKGALIVCLALMLYMTASDFLVDKVYRLSGICVFAVLLGYALVCLSREDGEQVINAFEIATQLFFILLILSSFLLKADNDNSRFAGPLRNPSIYALYLAAIYAVFLGALEGAFIKKQWIKAAILTTEMIIAAVLMVTSQSTTPLVAIVFISSIWIARLLNRMKGIRVTLIVMTIAAFAIIASLAVLVEFSSVNDTLNTNRFLIKLRSADLGILLSGRNYYWREYLEHMNLFGHGERPFFYDHRIYPHNALISMMYWYGVPCVIPYILMMIMAVEKSWRYSDTQLPYAAVPLYSIAAFIVMSMSDNVEQPFVWLPWIACYLMMAPILAMPIEEIGALKIKNNEEQKII